MTMVFKWGTLIRDDASETGRSKLSSPNGVHSELIAKGDGRTRTEKTRLGIRIISLAHPTGPSTKSPRMGSV